MAGVAPIQDKLRKNRLSWFEHICLRPIDVVVKRSDMIVDNTILEERIDRS